MRILLMHLKESETVLKFYSFTYISIPYHYYQLLLQLTNIFIMNPKNIFDEEFCQLVGSVVNQRNLRSYSKHQQIRIKSWVKKLSEITCNDLWRKNRNNYLKLLSEMVHSKVLFDVFNGMPPEGHLQKITDFEINKIKKQIEKGYHQEKQNYEQTNTIFSQFYNPDPSSRRSFVKKTARVEKLQNKQMYSHNQNSFKSSYPQYSQVELIPTKQQNNTNVKDKLKIQKEQSQSSFIAHSNLSYFSHNRTRKSQLKAENIEDNNPNTHEIQEQNTFSIDKSKIIDTINQFQQIQIEKILSKATNFLAQYQQDFKTDIEYSTILHNLYSYLGKNDLNESYTPILTQIDYQIKKQNIQQNKKTQQSHKKPQGIIVTQNLPIKSVNCIKKSKKPSLVLAKNEQSNEKIENYTTNDI